MPDPINAKYKIYDSTLVNGNPVGWVEYHLATNAGQVTTTYNSTSGYGRKFVTPSITINSNTAGTNGARVTVGSGDSANIEIDGAHITGQAYAVSGFDLVNISASDSVAVALGKLDHAVETVVPPGVLTTSNFGDSGKYPLLQSLETLGGYGVGQASPYDAVLANANGTWHYMNTGTFVYTTASVNNVHLSSNGNITLDASDIPMNKSVNPPSTIASTISSMYNAINGKTTAYAIDDTVTGVGVINGLFVDTRDDLAITDSAGNNILELMNGGQIRLGNLHIGDSIFVKQTNVPDRWLSYIEDEDTGVVHIYTYHFSKLETYNMAWGAITGTPDTLAGYGITDAKIEHGTITLGSDTITPITNAGTSGLYGNIVPSSSRSVSLGDGSHGYSDLYVENIHQASGSANLNLSATYIVTRSSMGLLLSGGTQAAANTFATLRTENLTDTRTFQFPDKAGTIALTSDTSLVTVGDTTTYPNGPTGAKTGDVWIDTTA